MLQCNMNAGENVVRLHGPKTPVEAANAPSFSPSAAAWSMWRRWFDGWEGGAAKLAEHTLRQAWVLEPAGLLLTSTMRCKSLADRMTDAWLGALGFSTRSERLRLQHEINRLASQVLDLEERLEDAARGEVP